MSMLAEKKRKQKWSLNPRGNDWVQDTNKFGQKLMEKMGWQHGKGLGAKEDGITEHIKVSYKNDSKGMGYKESNDQWTEHETNFTALLESLSGEKPDEIKLNSLEKKSQSSRARVHYHKFTRGKDLSRYSEKDLANIFGKKSLKDSKKVEKQQTLEEKNDNDSKFLFNAGSMRDYFKKKLPGFGKSNGYVVGHNGVLKKEESGSESDARPSFNSREDDDEDEEVSYIGFGFKSEDTSKVTFVSYVNGNCDEEHKEKKTKKKRRAEEKDVDDGLSPKKKLKEDASNNKGISNPAFNPLQTPVKVQKHVLETIEESTSDISEPEDDSVKFVVTTAQVYGNQRKKKKHLSDSSSCNVEVEESDEKGGKTKKKSKEVENGFVNGVFVENDVVEVELNDGKENEAEFSLYEVRRKGGKKKKQKPTQDDENSQEIGNMKSKRSEIETIESIDLTNVSEEIVELEEDVNIKQNGENQVKKPKKKKKVGASIDLTTQDSPDAPVIEEVPTKLKDKRKNKLKNSAVENPCFNTTLEDSIDLTQVEENPYEVKVKKKKKKAKGGIVNANFNEPVEDGRNIPQNEENPYEVKVPQEKKKKKKGDDYALENPNFNESLEEEKCTELKYNPYEVKPKKKKSKKKNEALAIDNPNFDPNDSAGTTVENNAFEVERKNKKSKNIQVTPPPTTDSPDIKEDISINVEESSDLVLNVVTTPIIARTDDRNNDSITRVNSVKRRKSVRFSDVTQEMIIPNNDDIRSLTDIENRNELFEINTQVINSNLEEQNISFDMSTLDKINFDHKRGKKRKLGVDNVAFDKQRNNLEENLDSISKTIDRYQAEIENDMNEKKLESLTMEDIMIGEVGNPQGDHEKLSDGTRLKFTYANFTSKTPFYQLDKTGARKSYKHLIKGDIVVGFKNTNLHEIPGYASRKKRVEV